MTRRLILFAHGSRDPRWRAPFEHLQQRLTASLGAGAVDLAYMEMVSPSLVDVAARAAAEGIRQLMVLPLFMSAGGHIRHDLPPLVASVEAAHPGLQVSVLPPIGEHETVIAALCAVAEGAYAMPLSTATP